MALIALCLPTTRLRAEAPVWRYTLLPGAYLLDDCPPCGRPTIQQPLRGTFDLRMIEENPLFSRFAVENVEWTAGDISGRLYKIRGQGDYEVGGEVALRQELTLKLYIDDGATNRVCYFTNATPFVERLWPMLAATEVQTNGTFTQVYQLQLSGAPFRELWFSTGSGLTPGIDNPPTNRLSGGDLLSSAGRVIRRNRELMAGLGMMPSPAPDDGGLDAMDLSPGGEVLFSIEKDVFSETLGPLHEGDLLSDRGRIWRRNPELTSGFGAMPLVPDVGLDAVQVQPDGEVYFSIREDFFSERLGRKVRRGDLLSSRGVVLKTNEELIARLHPANAKADYGLDAIYVWPSGEVWFSVETGFYGEHSEVYGHGDLLSDQGCVVIRNLDLVGPFQPLEDLADFGLDGLWVFTDVTAVASAPRITRIDRRPASGGVSLRWEGPGRVFQVERSEIAGGPYRPAGAPSPGLSYDEAGNIAPAGFYRLRQW